MFDATEAKHKAELLKKPRIIFAACTAAILFLIFIPLPNSIPGTFTFLPRAGTGLAFFCAIGAFLIPKYVLSVALKKGAPHNFEGALTMWFPSFIVGLALREAVTVLGLVLTVVQGADIYRSIFGLISISLMHSIWPREEDVDALVSK